MGVGSGPAAGIAQASLVGGEVAADRSRRHLNIPGAGVGGAGFSDPSPR